MADQEEKLDPDLQALMSELGKVEGEIKTEIESKQIEEQKPVEEQKPQEEIAVEEPKLISPEIVKHVEVEQVGIADKEKARIQSKLIGLIDIHCDNAVKIIEDVESDRKKCDDVYNILYAKVQDGDYRASDIAALVSVLQTKGDISKTRSDMMDSVAKMLASIKNNNTVPTDPNNGNGDLSQEDIKKLLSNES